MESNCGNCEHINECKNVYGEEYQAICGTHFCLKSWENIKKPFPSGLPKRSECHCSCHSGGITHMSACCSGD